MDHVTSSEIFQALESWKLEQARTLLEHDSHFLSDSDYARAMDQLYDCLEVSRLLNDLDNYIENKDYVAALQTLEDIQVNARATTHPEYERLLQKYRDFQTEHLGGTVRSWVAEIGKHLIAEDGELDLDKARQQLAEVDVLLKKINLLPDRLRKDYEPQIQRKVSEYEKKLGEAEFIDNIERADRAEYFAEAQKLLADAKAAGVPEKKLLALRERVEKNQKRAEGQSITFLNDPTKTEVERIEGASLSAKSAKAWRLAYNLAYHGYLNLDGPDSDRMRDEAFEYKVAYLDQLPKDINQQIKMAENAFEIGEYEEAKYALEWANKFGMSPGTFAGKITDYMDSDILKGNPLGEIEGGADLAARIAELKPKIQKGIENRHEAREFYARASMVMTSGTINKTADAMGLLIQALAIDERYQDALTLLSNLAEQYAASFTKIFEDKRTRFIASLQEGSWGRAQRYLENIQGFHERARKILQSYPQRLADNNPLKILPLDELADEISQRQASLEQLQVREKSANEKREVILQAFNAARNNLDQSRRGVIENLLNEWHELTLRKMDVNRVRQQVQNFWEQEYQWLVDNVNLIQDATNKGIFDGIQVLETVAGELEGRGQGLSKVEQALADYYGKLGSLKRRDDPYGAVDYYIKAERHAKLANNPVGSSSYHQSLEDLKGELKDKGAIIDTRRALENALHEKSYEEIEQILADLSQDLKNDIDIQRLGKKAKVALARFHHDRFLERCRSILSHAGEEEKGEFISPKDRDFEHARNLAGKAMGYLNSADANDMHNLAIKYQAQERESIEELDTYIKAQNYPAAADLVKEIVDSKYPYIGAKLWRKCAEAQNLYKKWKLDNQDNWETAKENAKAIIDRIDLRDDNAETMFTQAKALLEKCNSPDWGPEENFEAVIDKYINLPKNAFSEASKKYAQIKNSLTKGEITHAHDDVNSFPSSVPAQTEKSRLILRDHLAKLVQNLKTLRDELSGAKSTDNAENAKKSLLRVMNRQVSAISNVFAHLENAAEAAARFEGLLSGHDDTIPLLGDADIKKSDTSERDAFSLFSSAALRSLYRSEEEKYQYLKKITIYLDKEFEKSVSNYQIEDARSQLEIYLHTCPSSLADLGEGFRSLNQWLEEREIVSVALEGVSQKIDGHSFLPPSRPQLDQALETLASLDRMTLGTDLFGRYKESKPTTPINVEVSITSWERKRIRELRAKIKNKLETFWTRKAVISLLGFSFLFLMTVFCGIVYANRPIPTPIIVPKKPTLTMSATQIAPTLQPTLTLTPVTPTALPRISGITMGQMYIRRWPENGVEIIAPGYFQTNVSVDIVRYCISDANDYWLLIDLGDHYGWIMLYSTSNQPIVSIGGNIDMPEINLPPTYRVTCPEYKYTPVPGIPTPIPNWASD